MQPQEAAARRSEMQPREPAAISHRRDRVKLSHRCNCDVPMESAAPRLLPLAAAGFTCYHNRYNLIHLHIHCHQVFGEKKGIKAGNFGKRASGSLNETKNGVTQNPQEISNQHIS
ncbi:hypothetical protein WN944_029436 [Citrus x changshan-huyou]|uniref:Uncharacterized protein n=1 Tax=Citrus x changshan-huyou TaxID=2935761 RepID=A0AAP0LQQ5_9ROSI